MDLLERAFSIPMRMPFRGVTTRSGVLVNGPHGWGEFSPFPDYDESASALWLAAALEATSEPWPAPLRASIPVNVTVPAVGAGAAHSIVRSSGCRTAKVKVGDDGDEARVEAVRDALGPRGRIRIDVNGAWDVGNAAAKIKSLARYDLEYVEQPVASTPDMAALRRSVDVPIAADESIRKGDHRRVVELEAADVAVLKVHPLGGIRRALQIAEELALPAVVSSAIETSIGIAAGVALAAALPELPYACGLATVALLSDDVVADSLVPVEGSIVVRRPAVDDARLERVEPADGPEQRALFERLGRARAALASV